MTRAHIVLAIFFALFFVSAARAQNFVFDTDTARLVLASDGSVVSLLDKRDGVEELQPSKQPFASMNKNGQFYQATAIARSGNLLHLTFGASGVSADYLVTPASNYIQVQVEAIQGSGVEELRIAQLSTRLTTAGVYLHVLSDDKFAVCLMGLSEQVNFVAASGKTWASVYPDFPMLRQRIAIIAAPAPGFLDAVRIVEHDFSLPSPTLGGVWAKTSPDDRTSYLFTDLTEANVDDVIRYARLTNFRYVLINAGAWAASPGSYPINLRNYPHGEDGLRAVIAKCHAAGIKVGMHMLTSIVAKNDPMVRPTPSPGLYTDATATVASGLDPQSSEIAATSPEEVAGFSKNVAETGVSTDILIDSEIIHYSGVSGNKFLKCQRGYDGTTPAPHRAGATIRHLVQQAGDYLVDLRSPLADTLADRIAGLINRDGFDMVYFDAGEFDKVEGPYWYWVGVEQAKIWQRAKRELLMQGSGATNWTWHLFARGTCEDYAAVAPKQFLDDEKIDVALPAYRASFVPAELGWTGILTYAPDHPATTPDQLEYYAVRMLALSLPVSLETDTATLKANGRTDEMLSMMGEYEKLRLSGSLASNVRARLAQGEWHMTSPGNFVPIRYDEGTIPAPGEAQFNNQFGSQPLKFRLQVISQPANPGDAQNITLAQYSPAQPIPPPPGGKEVPGALALRIPATESQRTGNSFLHNPQAPAPTTLNLAVHRALAITLEVEGPSQASGPVLNVQLQDTNGNLRNYYVNLNFRARRTVVIDEPQNQLVMTNFRPVAANYRAQNALYRFDYSKVSGVNLRWAQYPANSGIRCTVNSVEALAEHSAPMNNIVVSLGNSTVAIPGSMDPGDYAEYWASGPIRIFDENGKLLRTVTVSTDPTVAAGFNTIRLRSAIPGRVKFTLIATGN